MILATFFFFVKLYRQEFKLYFFFYDSKLQNKNIITKNNTSITESSQYFNRTYDWKRVFLPLIKNIFKLKTFS